MLSSSGGEEQSQRSTGCEVWLRFDKQAGDCHSNQERKEHAMALEFAMQAAGWTGSAFHSWIEKAIREDHCLVLMFSTPLQAALAGASAPHSQEYSLGKKKVLVWPPNVLGLLLDGGGDMGSIWTSLLKSSGN